MLDATKRVADVGMDALVLGNLFDLLQCGDDGVQYPGDLVVLVNEHECVGHVAVTEMDHGTSNPVSSLLLGFVKNGVHGLGDCRAVLETLQSLSSIAETVVVVQHVLIRKHPEVEHLVGNLAPEIEGLVDVPVLSLVVVSQSSALTTRLNGE